MRSFDYEVYCDGAAAPTNPGPSSLGVVIIPAGQPPEEYSQFLGHGTNQTAELNAAIFGLSRTLEGSTVKLTSDSQYVLKGLTEWRNGWEARGWRNANKKPIANKDLWLKLFRLYDLRAVTTEWVRGHNGHDMNERCDQLATDALIRIGVIAHADEQPGS
jgi:ribonuclease HI